MKTDSGFFWKRETDVKNRLELIVIGYRNEKNSESSMEAWITPSIGSNLCRFIVDGKKVIDFDAELLEKMDYTGTPVLYPTPNRVRNGVFLNNGRIFNQVKNGERIFEHGLVHNEAFKCSEPLVQDTCVEFTTWIDFEEGGELFEAFPFRHRLSLEFKITQESLQVTYTIKNSDDKEIPYGFGLHPYFMKLSGDEETYIKLPAEYVMDYTSDLLPTGRLIHVDGTIYDLRQPIKTASLDLDHVFTGIGAGKFAEVEYKTEGLRILLSSSEDFSHLVVYSPRGMNYICIENQTCSTDAHNLYDRGFKSESGLEFVPPGSSKSGYVEYRRQRTSKTSKGRFS